MFAFGEMKLHTNLGVQGDVWLRGFLCNQKKCPKQKGKKKENAKGGKKGSGKKKLLLNEAEIEEWLVQLLYSGIRKSIEINQEIGCLLTEKWGYWGRLVGLWREQQTILPLSKCPHAWWACARQETSKQISRFSSFSAGCLQMMQTTWLEEGIDIVEGDWGSCWKNSSMQVSREAGDGVEMSCGDWTGASGEGWRAAVDFFSSEDFLLECDELGLEEMGMWSNVLLTTSFMWFWALSHLDWSASMAMAFLFLSKAAMEVVCVPAKASMTVSPGLENISIKHLMASTGLTA